MLPRRSFLAALGALWANLFGVRPVRADAEKTAKENYLAALRSPVPVNWYSDDLKEVVRETMLLLLFRDPYTCGIVASVNRIPRDRAKRLPHSRLHPGGAWRVYPYEGWPFEGMPKEWAGTGTRKS